MDLKVCRQENLEASDDTTLVRTHDRVAASGTWHLHAIDVLWGSDRLPDQGLTVVGVTNLLA